MRHAPPAALDQLEPLLTEVRPIAGLTEKARGTFYRKARAFLHFHEDPSGLYADIRRAGEDFERVKVDTPEEQAVLIETIKAALLPES